VGKMRTICGRDSPTPSRGAKLEGFSEDPQENPLETRVEKYKQNCRSRAFPPIHRAHHNNKSQSFQKSFLKTAEDVNKLAICDRCHLTPRMSVGAPKDPLVPAIFHSIIGACALYTLLKNEYSTLAGEVDRRNHDRNGRYRTRGKPSNGIQRKQVSAAQRT
jgi:hypothetical protein